MILNGKNDSRVFKRKQSFSFHKRSYPSTLFRHMVMRRVYSNKSCIFSIGDQVDQVSRAKPQPVLGNQSKEQIP